VHEQLSQVIAASRQGSLLREGVHVVIAGHPNVGKSSLLNRLTGSEVAIVTDIPGTTRDAIRATISVRGVPLHIIDTAGLRDPRDPVEKIGISKTWDALSKADLVLWVSDATRVETQVTDPELAVRLPTGIAQVRVVNKVDLVDGKSRQPALTEDLQVNVSAKTGAGMDLLRSAMLEAIGWNRSGEGVFMARARHLGALQAAAEHLAAAATRGGELELFAEELRLAQYALASIIGEFTSDDLLGKIFSHFCIGK
jgi:tRNA modification GTPase